MVSFQENIFTVLAVIALAVFGLCMVFRAEASATEPRTMFDIIAMTKEISTGENAVINIVLPPRSCDVSRWEVLCELPIYGERKGTLDKIGQIVNIQVNGKRPGKYSVIAATYGENGFLSGYRSAILEVKDKKYLSQEVFGLVNIIAGVMLTLIVQGVSRLVALIWGNVTKLSRFKALFDFEVRKSIEMLNEHKDLKEVADLSDSFSNPKNDRTFMLLEEPKIKDIIREHRRLVETSQNVNSLVAGLSELRRRMQSYRAPLRFYFTP